MQKSIAHKLEQLRKAHEAGNLDLGWAAEDILVFASKLATSWAEEHLHGVGVPLPTIFR